MGNNIVEITNLDLKTSSGNLLLKGVSFVIPKGKITILKAGNGVGKTQLMSRILNLKKKSHGDIKYHCDEINIGYLPQVENIHLTIPLLLGEISQSNNDFFPKILSLKPWNRASGGERKRCLITRAFHQKKSFLILDEPLNHLDKNTQKIVSQEIVKMCKNGTTFLMTGHVEVEMDLSLLNIVELEQWKC